MRGVRTIGEVDAAERRRANLQRYGLRRRLRRKVDPEFDARMRARERAYYQRNKEKIAARHKAWQQANRERRNAYMRRRYALNPALREYVTQKCREYRAAKRTA